MLDTLLGLAPQSSGGWTNWSPDDDRGYAPRGTPTVAGIDVSEESAMRLATVYACVTKLSKTIATLPAHVHERTGPKASVPVDHPLNEIFSSRANATSTCTTLRESMMGNGLWWGNQYARKETNQFGDL